MLLRNRLVKKSEERDVAWVDPSNFSFFGGRVKPEKVSACVHERFNNQRNVCLRVYTYLSLPMLFRYADRIH